MTGAGMMDCKKALSESNGDFEAAIDYLRKKGQKVAAKRADRDATEGVVIAQVNDANTAGTVVYVTCETDFVSKNADFIKFAQNAAMQIAAMRAVAVDESGISQDILDREFKIGREQALEEGKPEAIVDKIATGRVQKFIKESTLLNQAFVKNNKQNVAEFLNSVEKDLTVTKFQRVALGAL
ncbi:UNVERIFIED_CONTAM: hypothetical protein GTU68_043721 [Idotea baltica]|nr:hypothetical protein [Idotea baltica]